MIRCDDAADDDDDSHEHDVLHDAENAQPPMIFRHAARMTAIVARVLLSATSNLKAESPRSL